MTGRVAVKNIQEHASQSIHGSYTISFNAITCTCSAPQELSVAMAGKKALQVGSVAEFAQRGRALHGDPLVARLPKS